MISIRPRLVSELKIRITKLRLGLGLLPLLLFSLVYPQLGLA